MQPFEYKKLLLGTSLLISSAAFSGAAFAQTEDTPVPVEAITIDETEENEDEVKDTVVVTGSRIKKSTFSSISPIQTITTEFSRDVGLIDATQILQKSEAAAGQQIDSTFTGTVQDNGPGSETVSLRGLGANRTLLLLNGRRMSPVGAEGAPFAPSINLLPSTLVDRYDFLLDGASSVYGSDAVAGVINVILRKDFDGWDLEASGDLNQQGAGNDFTLSAAYGKNSDRGFFGIGAEYDYQDPVSFNDRDFSRNCETTREIDENGVIRTDDRSSQDAYAELGLFYPIEECSINGVGRRIRRLPAGLGFVYYTPGQTNVGIPNFSETTQFSVPVDGDGDGNVDVVLGDYDSNSIFNEATFINEQKRVSLMAYGEYTMEGEGNITPYFETVYSKNDIFGDSGASQLFTIVPASNQWNPCNPNQPNGVDCGLAADSLLTNPNYEEAFRRYYFDGGRSGFCAANGRDACTPQGFTDAGINLLNGPLGPQRAGAGVVVDGDRDQVNITLEQVRGVGGIKGDMPWLNFGSLNGWSFDASVAYSYSKGTSSRPGIRDDRLHYALGFDPNIRNATGQLVDLPGGPCTPAPGSPVSADIQNGCVPVNLFAESLFPDEVVGNFATQAETDYLFDSRDFDTRFSQVVFNGYVTGSLFSLPAGDVSMVVGLEHRYDEIESIPDAVARDGLFFGFFADQGAVGNKWTREAFAELDIPIAKDKPGFRQLDFALAGRLTEDEFYGTAGTYSLKAGWRPVDSLLLKGTFGTSFRAPNLRENFLLGTTGFVNAFDPCVTPSDAVGLDGSYNRAADTREDITLDNCRAEGIDPTNFSPIPGNAQVYSTERSSGGALDLREETSESFTVGASFEQPFTDWIDAKFNINYYSIDVTDTVVEPSVQFIINDCYTNRPNRESVFCSRITRTPFDASANPGSFDLINAGFINQDNEKVRGLDLNAEFDKEIGMFGKLVDWNLDVRATKLLERSSTFVDDDGVADFDDDVGEFGLPEWSGRATLRADFDEWRVTWQAVFLDAVEQDADGIDDFSDTVLGGSETCGGPTLGDVQCRDVGFADSYMTHTASVRYTGDDWSLIVGVENIFDKAPPLVDPTEVSSFNNVARGAGYDYDGRQFFATLRKSFR